MKNSRCRSYNLAGFWSSSSPRVSSRCRHRCGSSSKMYVIGCTRTPEPPNCTAEIHMVSGVSHYSVIHRCWYARIQHNGSLCSNHRTTVHSVILFICEKQVQSSVPLMFDRSKPQKMAEVICWVGDNDISTDTPTQTHSCDEAQTAKVYRADMIVCFNVNVCA